MAWISRWLNLFRGERLNRDLADELQFHLDSRVRRNADSGMERRQAEEDARRRFGNQTRALESVRDADMLVSVENLVQDLRFASRLMRRRPGFTTMAILLIGLGIGVSTAMFSLLVRAVFPRSAFDNSTQLVFLWRFDKKQDRFLERFSYPRSYSDLNDTRHESHGLDVSVYRGADFNVNVSGTPVSIRGFEIEPNWLQVIGVSPWLGRGISPGDHDVALITYELWKRLFEGDRQALGRTLNIDHRPFTVVGVLPAALTFDEAQIFTPLVRELNSEPLGPSYYALADLRGGFSLQQAQAEVEAIVPAREDWTIHLATLKEKTAGECGPTCEQRHNGTWLLFGAAALVMLLACANVANLLLAGSRRRRHEFLIRAAIGCSRYRLLRQIVTEKALLFLCGGGLAVIFARLFVVALARFAATYVDAQSLAGDIPLDSRALLFAFVATSLTALLFGAMPAVRSASALYNYGVREAPKLDSIPLQRSRARGLLVASEFALSLVLLVGFGLLLRSFVAVASIPVGVRTQRLLTTSTNVAKQYPDEAKRIAFAHALLEKMRGLPTVESVALTSSLPLTGAWDCRIRVQGVANPPSEVRFVSVSPNFFSAMGLPIIAGRPFSEHDSTGSAYVVVINQTMANALFPKGDALGQRIQMDEGPAVWREIVGVAADVRQRNLEEDSRPVFYRPYTQGIDYNLSLAVRVRSAAEMAVTGRAVRATLLEPDSDVAWEPLQSMRQIVYDSESLSLRRPVIRLLGAFGLLALLLTAAGLFAVVSFSVIERTREIGIRMAVGARPTQVLQQIIGETLKFALPGALLGAISSYALSQLLPSGHIGWSGSGVFLYGITRLDAVTYLGVLALLSIICLVATYVPARRAMQIDPSVALRED